MPIDDPTRLPKIGSQIVASLPKDPALKATVLAKAIFPDLPEGDALKRMGFDGSRFYFISHDGNAYYAEPKFAPIDDPVGTLKTLPDNIAANVGPALPAAGGMIAGALTTDVGGGIPGAAAGGAGGDALRQSLAALLAAEEMNWTDRAKGVAAASGEQAVNQILGLGLAKGGSVLLNRNPMKVGGYDASNFTKARMNETQANTDLARTLGISVTPGEAGNIGSLLANQRQIARQPEGNTILSDFYRKRNVEEIPDAWSKYISTVSPVGSSAVANRELGSAAGSAIKAAKAERKAASDPLYKSVVHPGNVLSNSDFVALVDSNPMFGTAIKAVRDDPLLAPLVDGMPDSSLPVLDLAKRHLDGLAKSFGKSGDSTRAGVAGKAADDLRSALDPLFPGYDKARDAFAGLSPEVKELEKGVVGIAAKDKPNALQNLPKVLFSATSSDPYSITKAKAAFQKAGKMDEWNAGVRSFLQNTFDEAVKQGGDAGPSNNLWKTISGDRRQLSNLKAALGGRQFEALEDFMKVAEMVKRGPKEGSPTATDLGARNRMAGPVARFTAKVAKGTNPLNWSDMVEASILETSAGKHAESLAKAITDPRAMESLRKLRRLPPGGQKFIQELGYLGGIMGWSQAAKPGTPTEPGSIPAQQ